MTENKISNINIAVNIKKILVVRSDRLGDVILSTPAFRVLRQNFPESFLAVLVCPYTEEIVCGNPDIDEVLVYDKQKEHKTWQASWDFIKRLKKYNFDAVIILNPSCRMHLIAFLAGIKYRIGYNRKWGWLLSNRIKDDKWQGLKHEFEYVLDMVCYFGKVIGHGIVIKDTSLHIPLHDEDSRIVDDYLKEKNISDNFVVIHPWASCPSRIWPEAKYIELCLRIKKQVGLDPVIICGLADLENTKMLLARIAEQGLKTHLFCHSLGKLAWLLKRGKLLVSSDTGPAHLAAAVGMPVVAIFGRNLPGLGPKRWKPLGENNIIIHKEIECAPCLAHNCQRGFACLKAITVDEVMEAIKKII